MILSIEPRTLVTNVTIYEEEKIIPNGYIVIHGEKIASIGSTMNHTLYKSCDEVIDGKGLIAIPGFIDGHIHGANGADVMDATTEALDVMARSLPEEGTTAFLATSLTQAPGAIERALENVATYENKSGCAEVVGIHLEGPFIDESKAGAQPKQYILKPSKQLFDKWQKLAGNKIKTVTLAPEHDKDGRFIQYLSKQNIVVSAGHTTATYEQMTDAIKYGLSQVTHLCNAMSGLHHRDIGVVGSALFLENLKSELIADGIHVSKEMIQLIYKNIGSSRLLLITDAIRAKCLQAGTYDLGGQGVTVAGGRATLHDGTLAGSIIKMNEAAQKMQEYVGASIAEIIEMTSTNPAKQLGIFNRKGSLKVGKDADLLLVDEHLHIAYTFCRGKLAFRRK